MANTGKVTNYFGTIVYVQTEELKIPIVENALVDLKRSFQPDIRKWLFPVWPQVGRDKFQTVNAGFWFAWEPGKEKVNNPDCTVNSSVLNLIMGSYGVHGSSYVGIPEPWTGWYVYHKN